MKAKGYRLIAFLLLTISLNGCDMPKDGGGQFVADNTPTAGFTAFPADYHKSGERVTINIESIQPEKAYFTEGSARPVALDYEAIGRALIPEDELGQVNRDAKQILSKNRVNDIFYEKMFLWGKDNFSFYTYHSNELSSSVVDEKKAEGYNLPLYLTEQSFSFGSAEDALKDVKTQLSELGIRIDETYFIHTYYLEHEILKQQESHLDMDGNRMEQAYKTDWSQADDAYLFYIGQTYCGLPDYYTSDVMSVRAEDCNAQITVMYGEKGIFYLKVQGICAYETGTEAIGLLPFETVAESVFDYFDNILDDAVREIRDAQLVCGHKTSQNSANGKPLRPVWAFRVEETNGEGFSYNYELRMDASTGRLVQ